MPDGDKAALVAAIKASFLHSGGLKEIQARLRSQIYLALRQQAGWKASLAARTRPSASPQLKALNWLICQHLVHHAYWMANSVLSRDGLRTCCFRSFLPMEIHKI
jgi:hypothetical protein